MDLASGDELATDREWRNVRATIHTREPGRVLPSVFAFAKNRDLEAWVHAAPHDRIVAILARLNEELGKARKRARGR